MRTYQFQQDARIPSYALSYLINGDSSGLSYEDITIIDRWYKTWQEVANRVNGSIVISTTDEREFFTARPEFGGLACDCVECDILVLVDNCLDINE